MEKESWPAWYYGPNGEEDIFESEKDVPAGWVDHPSKIKPTTAPAKPAAAPKETKAPVETKAPEGGDDKAANEPVDTGGWPWTSEIHAATKTKTKEGYWRMKVGVSRPAPKPGYPLDL